MRLKLIKKGFSYSQDGPGNRLVYHLQGCNMNCRWCANPESIGLEGSFIIHEENLLDEVCPFGNIRNRKLDRKACASCESRPCIKKYKNEGIQLSYFEMEETAIIAEVRESRSLFFDGGGITFTGGEPTLQFQALKRLLKTLKEEGIHTAIETNATHVRLQELFPYIDTLIMDFKHIDRKLHQMFTGISNEQIKRNIGKAMELHSNVLIRTLLVQGVNENEKFIKEYLSFYLQFQSRHTQFEFLKFHEYGKEKWKQVGLSYKMHNGYVSEETREAFEKEYEAKGLRITRT